MLSRWGMIGLLLVVLLASTAAAQPAVDSISKTEIERPGTSFLRDVAVMWLYVVKDRQIQALAFTSKDLTQAPDISVNGYVTGVVLLSTTPLSIFVNRQPASPIRTTAEGYYNVKYFGDLSRNAFWSTFLSSESKPTAAGQIRGRYSRFPKVPGDALCGKRRFRITVAQHGNRYHLTIRQNPRVIIDVRNDASNTPETPEFYYLGDNIRQFDHSPTDFRRRIQAILAGIRAAEAATGSRLVHQVDIIDLDGPRNALTCEGRNEIWIYSRLFWNEPPEELQTVAEHESMHILSDRLNLPTNSHIRELFAELMGFGAFSRERFCVLASGRPSAGHRQEDTACHASDLFDFISEINFIRGASGGHAQDDVNEFCASFLHTLMYIHRLGPMLTRPIKTRDGSLVTLSTAQQKILLDEYKSVLAAMLKAIPGNAPAASLLHAGLDAADRIGIHSGAGCIASNKQP